MASRFLNNIKINDAYALPPAIGTTGQFIKLTDAATGTTNWADIAVTSEVSIISYEVRNETGSPIPIGSVVYVSGGSGASDHVTIALSTAATEAGSSKTFAITAETINHNSTGKVVLEGIIEGINTGSFTPGQTLWLSTTAGQITNIPPTTPNHAVFVGYAVRCQQNNGSIFVKIQNGVELGEIHDVLLTSTADKNIIRYDSALGYWVNSTVASILPDSGVIAGQYGDASNIPQITIGADGRITSATDVAVNIPAGTTVGTAGNEVSGTVTLEGGGDTTVTQAGNLITISSTSSGSGAATLSIERNVFTATANQTAFTITSPITSSSNTQVYIDGVYQAKSNYTASGSTITFFTGVPLGVEVEVVHFISVYSKIYTDSFTGNGTTVDYTASKDVTDENGTQVYIDGVYQSKDNYTTSGTTITFSTAPPNGSAIEVVHFTAVDYSSIASNQFTGTGSQTDFTLTQGVSVDNSFVFIQGVYQEKSTYSITDTTLAFTTAPLNGYTIEVVTFGVIANVTSSPVNSVNSLTGSLNIIGGNDITVTPSGSNITIDSNVSTSYAVSVISTNTTAVANTLYVLTANLTLTLPASPSNGDSIKISNRSSVATCIIARNGENIMGAASDLTIDKLSSGFEMIYSGSAEGWILIGVEGTAA